MQLEGVLLARRIWALTCARYVTNVAFGFFPSRPRMDDGFNKQGWDHAANARRSLESIV